VKVGIVGANSQVGTELTALFAEHDDVTVAPIDRNRLGTHYLRHLGIDCRIADVTDDADATEALDDLDVVVIAAFAWQYSQEGFEARGARKANENIVRNTVEHAPGGARIVYFSSQAAYGDEINAPQYTDWSLYTREKRNAEKVLRESCEGTSKRGYAFRLGFVHGPNQSRTKALREELSNDSHVYVVADPDKPSNVVHTVTLRDAILQCASGNVSSGIYSITNEPQWTWNAVCEYYSPDDVTLHYRPPGGSTSKVKKLLGKGWSVIEDRQRTLRTATVYIPDLVNEWLFNKYLQQQRGGEIGALESRKSLDRPAFKFDPMPGSNVPGLTSTESQLEDFETIRDSFEEERPWTQT
jgi:dTDP-4-dehydrorhamnose reductase